MEQPLKTSVSSQQLCGLMEEHGDRRVICAAAVEPNFISTYLMMSQKIFGVVGGSPSWMVVEVKNCHDFSMEKKFSMLAR